jgi:GMP synthase-like glutamine amidotransferase
VAVLVVQHQADAPPALLADALAARGLSASLVDLGRGDALPARDPAHPASAVVVLGSDASAIAPGAPPWIEDEVAWLRDLAAAGTPVLGICFGAQVLARALGGGVRRLPAPQIGWIDAGTRDAARIPAGPWLSWHEDVVDLPPGAELLAADATGPQAFARGAQLGVQFHPEVTPAVVDDWIAAYDGRELAGEVLDVAALRAATARHASAAAQRARRLFDAWLAGAGLAAGAPR